MPKVSFNDLVAFGTRVLADCGASEDDARYMAERASVTEAGGVSTHGAIIFAAYPGQIGKGIDPAAAPKVVSERPGTALIDGSGCFAPLAMRLATQLAVEKARTNGIANVGVRNTCWLAGAASYLLPIVAEGLFAQVWVQSSQCRDSAPPGGIDAKFSTNPVAFAFPTPAGPVLADFSTSVYSMGKVNLLAKAGKKAPEPVFFDADGKLTDDPAVMTGENPGAMLMAGQLVNEHKGYALALWAEAMTVMAGGSANNPDLPQRQSFNLTVIDPSAFAGSDYYDPEMARFVAHVKSSRRREGVDEIRLPGERFLRQIEQSKADGVDLRQGLFDKLNEVAAERGVEPLAEMVAAS